MSSSILAFVSIFLSLTVGVHPVEVLVSDEVERVEVWLDDELAGTMTAPVWTLDVDFGRLLVPHRLRAVAYGSEDKELAVADQWINLPSPTADADLIVVRSSDGDAFARLTWANVMGTDPEEIRLSLDGRPLVVEDPEHIPLPPHDLEQLHFMRAELVFDRNVSVVKEVTFGGSYGDQVNTDLTAVPVLLEGKKQKLPTTEQLQDWFEIEGQPVAIAAVDEGPAEIIVVRDRSVQNAIERLVAGNSARRSNGAELSRSFYSARFDNTLKAGQNLAFFWPFMVQAPSGQWIFPPPFGWMTREDGGIGWFLASVRPPPPPDGGEQLLTDAIAVAGMNSLTRNRRRAVVLILGRDPEDASLLNPGAVRYFLESLRVPLFVWSPFPHPDSKWGGVRDISNQGKLRNAVSELTESLTRQRVVWFEGRFRPQDVRLTEHAVGVSFPN